MELGQLSSNCSSTTSHHCDPGQVLNVVDATSPCWCALSTHYSHASGSSLLQETTGFLRCRSKCHFPQGRTVEPRKLRLPRAVFSQQGQELEDKSRRTLAIRGTTLRHILQSPIFSQEDWVSVAHNSHLLITVLISHLHFLLVPFGITTLHLAPPSKAWLRV